jgi:hypothetical protein
MKSVAPYDLASSAFSIDVDIADVFSPFYNTLILNTKAAENLIPICPSPPIPMIPTSIPGFPSLFKGA